MLYASRYLNKDYTIKQRTYLIMRVMARKYQLPGWRVLGYPFTPVSVLVHRFFYGFLAWLRPRWRQGTGARHIEVQIMGDSGRVQGMIIRHDPLMISKPTTRNPGGIQYINVHNISSFCMGLIIRKDWHCRRGIRPRRWHFINEDCSVRENMNRNWKEPKCLGREMVGLFAFMFENGLRTMQNLCHCPSIYSMHMGVLYDIGIKKNMVVSVTLYT